MRSLQVSKIYSEKVLLWTVEWIMEDGARHLLTIPEHTTIFAAYLRVVKSQQSQNRKRKLGFEPDERHTSGSKMSDTVTAAEDSKLSPSQSVPVNHPADGRIDRISADKIASTSMDTSPSTKNTSRAPGTTNQTAPETINTVPPPASQQYFYLRRPFTPASSVVLIPFQPTVTLRELLRTRTVIEFPTIHVRSEMPSELPEGVVTEENYFQSEKVELEKLRKLAGGLDGFVVAENVRNGSTRVQQEEGLDAKEVLNVIQRDLVR